MDQALEADDLGGWAEADVRFHILLVELGNNNRSRRLGQTYFDQAHRMRMLTLRLRPKPSDSNDEHRKLFEMIQKGGKEKARRIHYKHREKSGKMLLSLLESCGFVQL